MENQTLLPLSQMTKSQLIEHLEASLRKRGVSINDDIRVEMEDSTEDKLRDLMSRAEEPPDEKVAEAMVADARSLLQEKDTIKQFLEPLVCKARLGQDVTEEYRPLPRAEGALHLLDFFLRSRKRTAMEELLKRPELEKLNREEREEIQKILDFFVPLAGAAKVAYLEDEMGRVNSCTSVRPRRMMVDLQRGFVQLKFDLLSEHRVVFYTVSDVDDVVLICKAILDAVKDTMKLTDGIEVKLSSDFIEHLDTGIEKCGEVVKELATQIAKIKEARQKNLSQTSSIELKREIIL